MASEVFPKRDPEKLAFERVPENAEVPREVLPKCELSMCESARFVETADEVRELADIELLPRAPVEFELTPGVKLEPRELPAFIVDEPPRFAPAAEFAVPPPARPK